jgi:hypothetical protein
VEGFQLFSSSVEQLTKKVNAYFDHSFYVYALSFQADYFSTALFLALFY